MPQNTFACAKVFWGIFACKRNEPEAFSRHPLVLKNASEYFCTQKMDIKRTTQVNWLWGRAFRMAVHARAKSFSSQALKEAPYVSTWVLSQGRSISTTTQLVRNGQGTWNMLGDRMIHYDITDRIAVEPVKLPYKVPSSEWNTKTTYPNESFANLCRWSLNFFAELEHSVQAFR